MFVYAISKLNIFMAFKQINFYKTILHRTCASGNMEFQKNDIFDTVLHSAYASKNIELVKYLASLDRVDVNVIIIFKRKIIFNDI